MQFRLSNSQRYLVVGLVALRLPLTVTIRVSTGNLRNRYSRRAEGLWHMRRHGPVIAQCTDSVVFPLALWLVSGLALTKYYCELGNLNCTFTLFVSRARTTGSKFMHVIFHPYRPKSVLEFAICLYSGHAEDLGHMRYICLIDGGKWSCIGEIKGLIQVPR